jgi:hypothetical protein
MTFVPSASKRVKQSAGHTSYRARYAPLAWRPLGLACVICIYKTNTAVFYLLSCHLFFSFTSSNLLQDLIHMDTVRRPEHRLPDMCSILGVSYLKRKFASITHNKRRCKSPGYDICGNIRVTPPPPLNTRGNASFVVCFHIVLSCSVCSHSWN